MANREGLQGYVTHQAFKGLRIPATSQNLVMRDYVRGKGKVFRLSRGEYFFDGCYVQLYAMLRDLDQIEGIVMCSLFMLPDKPEKRREIFDAVLAAGASMHFIYETLVVEDEAGVQAAEDLLLLNAALENAPRTIDPALLPAIEGVDSFT
jgi:sporadic carbohydrate cluster protein (TIGR04323 family)